MKRLIVDGYNVIRSVAPYKRLSDADDLDVARAALVSDVAAFAQGGWDATIVFDGHGNPHSDGTPHHTIGVTVVFSPFGVDADTVIERLARSARESGDHVEVVTSDAQTQWAVLGTGVIRRSSNEFAEDLRADDAEWRGHNPAGRRVTRLEDQLPAGIREALEKWARGG